MTTLQDLNRAVATIHPAAERLAKGTGRRLPMREPMACDACGEVVEMATLRNDPDYRKVVLEGCVCGHPDNACETETVPLCPCGAVESFQSAACPECDCYPCFCEVTP